MARKKSLARIPHVHQERVLLNMVPAAGRKLFCRQLNDAQLAVPGETVANLVDRPACGVGLDVAMRDITHPPVGCDTSIPILVESATGLPWLSKVIVTVCCQTDPSE
jgi:hypothetical protein